MSVADLYCLLLLCFTPISPTVGSREGKGPLCPAASSVNEEGMQGTVIRAVVPGPPHPWDKGLVFFFRLLSDGQKLSFFLFISVNGYPKMQTAMALVCLGFFCLLKIL